MVDTFAHAAISYLVFRKFVRSKKELVLSMFFGILPDLFSWTIYLIYTVLMGEFFIGRHELTNVPSWVFVLYGVTHSIFIYCFVLLVVYLVYKRIPTYLYAWGLHILIDIPTHSREFVPTPFLWPFFNWYFPGISWGTPWMLFSYWGLIILGFFWVLYEKIRKTNENKTRYK